jgi:hypothetical protein
MSVEGLVALAEGSELLVKASRFGFQVLALPNESLDLLGDLIAELIDAGFVVPAQRVPEVVAPDVERREME